VNRRPPAADELARLYSMDFYWHGRVRTKGQPPIERRAALDRSDGRVEYWASLVERHAPGARHVLEVGVGSGVLLEELKARGYDVLGVEPDEKTAAWTQERTGVEVRSGLFPLAGLPQVDLFLAFDVLEHSRDPVAFLRGAASLLPLGGTAIIQTPIDREHQEPPFGAGSKHVFDDVEHCYLFTDDSMRRLAEAAGLETRDLSERLWVQHEIAVLGRPAT
jgi:2-polyprenyl-3-methyl-5-hydroxy-6-metoxy-1,4-benzoquinol methylase